MVSATRALYSKYSMRVATIYLAIYKHQEISSDHQIEFNRSSIIMIVQSFLRINNNQDVTKISHRHHADASTSDVESPADYPNKEIPTIFYYMVNPICALYLKYSIAFWTFKMIRNTLNSVIQESNKTKTTNTKLPAKSPAPCRTKSIYLDQTWLKKSMKMPTKKKDLSATSIISSASSSSSTIITKRSNRVSYKNHSSLGSSLPSSMRNLSSWRRNCQHRRHSYPPQFQTTLSLIEEVDEL